MCLMVWVGTATAVPAVAGPTRHDVDADYYCVEDVAADAPIRARFTSPHVTYVGSHEGCGCGFNSADLLFQGIDMMTEATALLGAMDEEERADLAAEQRSRTRLGALVCAALQHGLVEIYGCWAGDEAEPLSDERTIVPSWLTERTVPIEERVRYRVIAAATA